MKNTHGVQKKNIFFYKMNERNKTIPRYSYKKSALNSRFLMAVVISIKEAEEHKR